MLTCGSARFTLPTLPVEDYPALPAMPEPPARSRGDVFAAAVAQVAIAAGRDDTLPVLTGVRLEIEGDTLTLAATDRYRLAVRELAVDARADPGSSAIALVPARTLAETAKALAGGREVTLALAARRRRRGHDRLRGRRPAHDLAAARGRVPEVPLAAAERVAQRRPRSRPPPLVEAVKRVALVAERNTPVRLSFSADGVVLEAGGADDAQAVRGAGARRSSGERHLDRVQPAVPARRPRRGRRATRRAVVHRPDQAGRAHRQATTPTRPPATTTATCSCRCACPAERR